MEFHTRLNYLIKQSGFTQKQVANALSVSPSTVSKWVNGRCEPNIEKLIGLSCQVFYVTLDELIIGNTVIDELLEEKYGSPKLVG